MHAAILVSRLADKITDEQQQLLDRIQGRCPEVVDLRRIALSFRDALMADQSTEVDCRNQALRVRPSRSFRLWPGKDISAVDIAWSTGQVEGQINRLKMIKRQMYGRAGFDLITRPRLAVCSYNLRSAVPLTCIKPRKSPIQNIEIIGICGAGDLSGSAIASRCGQAARRRSRRLGGARYKTRSTPQGIDGLVPELDPLSVKLDGTRYHESISFLAEMQVLEKAF